MSHIPFFNRWNYGKTDLTCPYCCRPLKDFQESCECGAYKWNTRAWIHPHWPQQWRNPKHNYPPDFDTEWALMLEEFTLRTTEGYRCDISSNYWIHPTKSPIPREHGYEMNHETGQWQKVAPRHKPGPGFWPAKKKTGLEAFLKK